MFGYYDITEYLTEQLKSNLIDVTGEIKVKMTDPCIYTTNGGIEDSRNEEVTVQSCDNHVQVYIRV